MMIDKVVCPTVISTMGKNRGKVPEAGWEIPTRGWLGWVSLRLGTLEQKLEAIEEAGQRRSAEEHSRWREQEKHSPRFWR